MATATMTSNGKTEQGQSSWIMDLMTVKPPLFTDRNSLPEPRWFAWYNRGHLREAGFFYTRGLPGDNLGRPWQSAEVFKNEPGWRAAGLSIAPICYRARPFTFVETTNGQRRQYMDEWDGESQFHTEIICFVRGSTDIWKLSSDGMVGKALSEILSEYKSTLLKYAWYTCGGANVPLWTFYLPITGRKEADGKPRFDPASKDGKGGVVTLPELVYPNDPYEVLAERFKVGLDLLAFGVQVRQMFDGWLHEKN